MKTKLLRKLRRQAEKKIYVRRSVDGSYEIYNGGYIYKDLLKEEAIEFCKFLRSLEIVEELGRLQPPKRIFGLKYQVVKCRDSRKIKIKRYNHDSEQNKHQLTMNFTHVKNKIFVVRSGFLVIGRRTYGEPGLDRWAIELRWRCPLLLVCHRLYYGASRPSKRRILLCAVFAPLLTGLQWLILLPFFLVVWAIGSVFFLGTLCVGWLFVGLGQWLVKIGRLGR